MAGLGGQVELFVSSSLSTPWKGTSSGYGQVTLVDGSGGAISANTPLFVSGGGATVATVALLGIGASYTTAALQPTASVCYFVADFFADQAGTCFVERSIDAGATWYPCNGSAGTALAAGASVLLRFPITAGRYRARFVNGAVANTSFCVTTAFLMN